MKDATVIEITTFQLNEGVPAELLLQAADKMQKEFLAKADGFISRSITVEENGTWRDIIAWKDKRSMEEAAQRAMEPGAAVPFMRCIDFDSVVMKAVEIKAHY